MKNILTKLTFSILIVGVFLPISLDGISRVYAVDAVRIIEDVTSNAINLESIKDLTNLVTSIQKTLEDKEFTGDPLVWLAKEQAQQQLSGNFIKFLGGQLPGQNGQSPIIKNYSERLQQTIDAVSGEVIFGRELTGLCSEEEDFLVQRDAYNHFLKSKEEEINQCDASESNNQVGVLEKMFRKNAGCNDLNCASYKGQTALAERQAQAVANDLKVFDYTRGMEPTRVCKTINDPDGYPRRICEIVNPPSLLPDSTSFVLGELPALQLLNMDELNEVVSNFMSNLTNQAITGFSGVLGLSGDPNYGQNVFGPDGNLSYADALASDDISQYQKLGENPIKRALETQIEYELLLKQVLDTIQAVEDKLAANTEEFPNCFDMELDRDFNVNEETYNLAQEKAAAEANLQVSSTTKAVLQLLDSQYDNATDNNVKTSVLSSFFDYQTQGVFRNEFDNSDFETTYIKLDLAIMVDKFKYDMATEKFNCGGEFDYEGIIDNDTSTSTATSTPSV